MRILKNNSSAHLTCPRASAVTLYRLKHVVAVVVVALVFWIGVTLTVRSQCPCDLTYIFTGEAAYDYFGRRLVSGAGDVNNDDFDNLIMGARGNDAGRAYVRAPRQVICGDCNGNGVVNEADVICEINYLFIGTSPPEPPCIDDVNCDGQVDMGDVVYKIYYLFLGGPAPCSECCP